MKKIYLLIVLITVLFTSCSNEDTEIIDNNHESSELSVSLRKITIEFKENTSELEKNTLKEEFNITQVTEINNQKEEWIVQTIYTNELITDIIAFNDFVLELAIENLATREGVEDDESDEDSTGGDKDNAEDDEEQEREGDSTGGDKDNAEDDEEQEREGDSTGGDKDNAEDDEEQEREGDSTGGDKDNAEDDEEQEKEVSDNVNNNK